MKLENLGLECRDSDVVFHCESSQEAARLANTLSEMFSTIPPRVCVEEILARFTDFVLEQYQPQKKSIKIEKYSNPLIQLVSKIEVSDETELARFHGMRFQGKCPQCGARDYHRNVAEALWSLSQHMRYEHSSAFENRMKQEWKSEFTSYRNNWR